VPIQCYINQHFKTKKQNRLARQENSNAVMHNARGMFAKQVVLEKECFFVLNIVFLIVIPSDSEGSRYA
jgi:hypothetical protein